VRGLAHQGQHQAFHAAAGLFVGVDGLRAGVGGQLLPHPVDLPQVGRVHAVGTGNLLHSAVLREQHHRRHRLAGELAADEIEQRERGLFDRLHRRHVQQRRFADQALHGRFARAQHVGHRRHAHELERAHALVQLRARGAQHGRIDGVDVRGTRGVGFFQITAQRLVRVFERTAQLAVHPRECAQVVAAGAGFAAGGDIHLSEPSDAAIELPAAEPALPGRWRTAPLGGSERK
jgi:hypothetical protein